MRTRSSWTVCSPRRTLIRRVSFDLLGLPPTPEEVEAFVEDSAPDAYAKLVDRLLASPHPHPPRLVRSARPAAHAGGGRGVRRRLRSGCVREARGPSARLAAPSSAASRSIC